MHCLCRHLSGAQGSDVMFCHEVSSVEHLMDGLVMWVLSRHSPAAVSSEAV